ncbi:MAG TPA: trehalase family glycosidase, partial [Victivallales bacterium]|nr:trehalase family glycosidase [Victivallales bacterium]
MQKTRYVIKNKWVDENKFISMEPERTNLPSFNEVKNLLPKPFLNRNSIAIDCYWKVWEIAFKNLKPATQENGFIANYIDTAFNNYIFMWDSVFILMFGKYGRRAFNFQRTLDNFYCKQEADGYISREIHNDTGVYRWEAYDPVSTGPNIMHWSEFEHYLNYADKKRLEMIFPPLVAYHEWTRLFRSWPDGSYWNTGYGCGMDNQPRLKDDNLQMQNAHHGFLSWIDANFQALFSAKNLLKIAEILGRKDEVKFLEIEAEFLQQFINEKMWNEKESFYFDRYRDGTLNSVKSVGAFWGLIADAVPEERLDTFISNLKDEKQFNRPHRVPSINANHPAYKSDGGYWLGSVWPPTNYMILRGLTKIGEDDLAFEIAENHLKNVWAVFKKYGTVFENYSPEFEEPGKPAMKDFVGWGGVPPIAV